MNLIGSMNSIVLDNREVMHNFWSEIRLQQVDMAQWVVKLDILVVKPLEATTGLKWATVRFFFLLYHFDLTPAAMCKSS